MNSQIGQDKFVCDFFNYKRDGYFLDIGAFDGIIISNTWYLEQLGWDGICVEAGEENFKKLKKNRFCTCLNLAISDVNGPVKFEENHTVGKIGTGKEVISLTFDVLLKSWKCPKVIDYISLDIEGSEYIALTQFPFKKHEVIIWTIEHNSHLDGGKMRDQIRELMLSNGYNLKESGYDFEDWFLNSKYVNE